ncbi:hypothetical protein Tco_0272246 [Tanacetum coccineum]
MSTSTHPIIVPSDYDVEDAFSTTNTPDYTPASPDYFPASPGNTSPDPSDDLSKYLLASLAISPFHDDPYMKVMQAYDATNNESPIPLPRAPIAPPTVLPSSPMLPLSPIYSKCRVPDTCPPCLIESDFESWQQRIRLYCKGKDNRENILKSIDEGSLKMGKFKERLAGGAEGALHLGLERDRVVADLKPEEKESNRGNANENKMMLEKFTQPIIDPIAFMSNVSPHQYLSQSSAILISSILPFLPNHTKHTFLKPTINSELHLTPRTKPQFKTAGLLFRMFRVDRTEVRGIKQGEQLKLEIGSFRNRVGNTNPEYFKDKMLLMQAQENGVVLDEEQLLFIAGRWTKLTRFEDDCGEVTVQLLALNKDKSFKLIKCDAFDLMLDEGSTARLHVLAIYHQTPNLVCDPHMFQTF